MTALSNWVHGRRRPRVVAGLALGLVIGMTAAACSGSASAPNAGGSGGANGAAAPSVVSGAGQRDGTGAKVEQPGDVGPVPGQQGQGPLNAPVTDPALIVRTGNLTIEVDGV